MSLLKYFSMTKSGHQGSEIDSEYESVANSENYQASESASSQSEKVELDRTVGSEEPKTKKRRKKPLIRNYNPEYLKFGFILGGSEDLPLPLCVKKRIRINR